VYGGICYYVIDTIYVTVVYGTGMDLPTFSLYLHHLICLIASYPVGTVIHYPWFVAAPLAQHTFLILFPHVKFFHYPYAVLYFLFLYGLSVNPFNTNFKY